jgi:UDP-glucose 4-epimerase
MAIAQDIDGVFNLGTDKGHSNMEVVDMAKSIVARNIVVSTGPRRSGDPAQLTASPDRWVRATGWQPKFELRDIIQHAWTWYTR